MKNKLLILLFSLLFSVAMNGQSKKEWSFFSSNESISVSKTVQRSDFPQDFLLFNLDLESIKQKLYTAEDRFAINAKGAIIEIPNSQGKLEKFKMYEASNFDPALQVQFPDIRAYVGQGIDNVNAQIRLSISPEGISTMTFKADAPTEYIEVYSADKKVYAVYNRDAKRMKKPFTCSTPDEKLEQDLIDRTSSMERSSNPILRTFKLAMSVTGEYSAFHGGTIPLVLAAVNTTLTRCNGVYEKDLAIHLNLVNNTTILYLDAVTDPYGDTDTNYNSELQTTLTSIVGDANYDIGHLMSAIGNNGNAGCIGCICVNGSKGSGFTTSTSPVGDNFDIDFVVHEMGHQFGANHSFSFSTENNSVNYEPGSGVTIMGYAGITSYDVAAHSIDTYHAGNIAQIQTNMTGKTCDVETAITHGTPVVTVGANYTIPKSTPFVLTGSATDTGGTGSITYQWEQYDDATATAQLTTGSPASETKTAGPNFRSYLPTTTGTRYFPVMESTLAGSKTTTGKSIIVEALSSVARTLNFRLTARDNALNGGQTNFGNVIVTVANIAPLDVTSQNTDGVSYPVGSTQTVTWTSAGNSGIAGGANVDILLSTNNGATWAYTLATATPNDGSQAITLPVGVSAPFCRFMVKANANIFFNVTTKAFAVGYTVTNTCNTYTNNTALPFVDQAPGNYTNSTLSVPMTSTISSISAFTKITHTYLSDVQFEISSPINPSTYVKLFNRSCGNTNGSLNLKFTDGAGSINCTAGGTTLQTVAPSDALSAFSGQNPNGTWKFRVYDNFSGDTGTINSWGVEICSQTIVSLSNDSFTGLDHFNIYPNPNNGNFNINFTSESLEEVLVSVHDIRGRQVYNKSFSNNAIFNENIQLNNVSSGIYIVTVKNGERKENKKIVIE
jgi:subtilisin-like proprotein convertase family protein